MSQNFANEDLIARGSSSYSHNAMHYFAKFKSELRRISLPSLDLVRVTASQNQSYVNILLDHGQHTVKRIYADWRVGATEADRRIHKADDSIFFTFDDFGQPRQVAKLLEVLHEQNIRAGFFLRGDWAKSHPTIVKKIADDGHLLGNHTFSHPDLLRLTDDQIRSEIGRGVASSWLRPPMGRYDNRVRKIAKDMGYEIAYWSIDSDDWQGVSADYMLRKILSELHPGAVILFHLHAQNTYKLLPELIQNIRERGYHIASKQDLIA